MAERRAARGRPIASAGQQPSGARDADAGGVEGLSRAQARALARAAPLTPAEFKARRRVAEEGLVSLRELLDDGPDAAAEGDPDRT